MVDYFRSIQHAVRFIETNLTRDFSIEDVSREAFQSRWHFQRVFRLITGYSVYDYVKRRRLAEAGTELMLERGKVIDIALKYQYGSPEAFSRAFTKEYGVSPLEFRMATIEHRIFPPLEVDPEQATARYGQGDIRYAPVTRNGMVIVGRKFRTSMKNGQNETDVPQAWAEFSQLKFEEKLGGRDRFPGNYGVYYEWDFDENFSILLGCQVESEAAAADWTARQDAGAYAFHSLKPCKYIVFTIPGRENADILAGWNYIYGNWMPRTGYDRDISEDFDFFDDRFYGSEPTSEIYIPIK